MTWSGSPLSTIAASSGAVLATLIAPAVAQGTAPAGWAAAAVVGAAAALPVAVVAAQSPIAGGTPCAPRTAWALAAVAGLAVAVAYNPLLDPYCPNSCAPLPPALRQATDQQALSLALAVTVTVSAALRCPRRPVGGWRGAALWISLALALVPWWTRVVPAPVSTVRPWSAAAAVIALASATTLAITLLRRRSRARQVAASLRPSPGPYAAPEDVRATLTPAERLSLSTAEVERELDAVARHLAESRRQLASALDAERARITADLHDLAQQRIVGVLLHTRALARIGEGRDALAGVGDELSEVLDTIRGLAAQERLQAAGTTGCPPPGESDRCAW